MDWRRKLLRVCDDRIPVPERHATIAEFADADPSDMCESARRIHKEVKLTPLDLMSERWQSLLRLLAKACDVFINEKHKPSVFLHKQKLFRAKIRII